VSRIPRAAAADNGLAGEYQGDHTLGDLPGARKLPPVRPVGAYQPFPVDALPPTLAEFVRHAAAAMGCDPAHVALPALAAAGGLIGSCRCVLVKRSWTEPAVIWGAVLGESGTLKTPAARLALAPVYRLQATLFDDHEGRLADYEEKKEKHAEERRKHAAALRNKKKGDPDPPPLGAPPEEPAACRRLITSDVTVEKLACLLAENSKGLLVARDELGGWLAGFTRYRAKGAAGDLPDWLELHQAGTVLRDRQTGEQRYVCARHACASVYGSIQPATFARALTEEYRAAGLHCRMLLAMPPRRPKKWTDVEVAPEVAEAYAGVLGKLAGLSLSKDGDGNEAPFAVRMDPEAMRLWVAFYDEWAEVQAAAEGELASAFSKLEAYSLRLALLHHVVSRVAAGEDDCDPLTGPSMAAGITLARWFADEARRVYSVLAEGEAERRLRQLYEYVERRGGVLTAKELQRANGAKFPSGDHAAVALDELVAAGLGEWEERPPGPRGGRPSRALRLKPYPTTDETDETPDAADPPGAPPADETPDETPGGQQKPLAPEGFVGFVGGRVDEPDAPRPPEAPRGGSSGGGEVSSGGFGPDAGTTGPGLPDDFEEH
jgi:hypothetical protein